MELLINHIQRVKRFKGFEGAKVVFIPESNYAFEGTHQRDAIQNSGLDAVVMYEDDNRAGVRTNNELKKLMAYEFKYKLHKKNIKIHEDFFTLSENYTVEKMKGEIYDQAYNYSRILLPSKSPHIPPKEIFGGKTGFGYDDLMIALQLNPLMEKRFFDSIKYKRFW